MIPLSKECRILIPAVKGTRIASYQKIQNRFVNSSSQTALSETTSPHYREGALFVRDPMKTHSKTDFHPQCKSPESAIVAENWGTADPDLQQRQLSSPALPLVLPSSVAAELLKFGRHWRTSEGRGKVAVHLDQQKHICQLKTIKPCVSDNGGYLRT